MRTNIQPGAQFLVFQENDSIILKKSTSIQTQEDLEFEKRTEAAIKEIEAGKGVRVDVKDLEEVMDSW